MNKQTRPQKRIGRHLMHNHRWNIAALVAALSFVAFSAPANAALLISIPDIVVDPGDSGFFDVLLTNPADGTPVAISAFLIHLSLNSPAGVQFTGVATSPTSPTYIFDGTGLVGTIPFPPPFDFEVAFSPDTFPNTTFFALDIAETVLSVDLDPGDTLSLGRVSFEVPASTPPGRVVPITFGNLDPTIGDFTSLADELGLPFEFFDRQAGSITISGDISPMPVPEPTSLTILATMLGSVAAGHFWRRPKANPGCAARPWATL